MELRVVSLNSERLNFLDRRHHSILLPVSLLRVLLVNILSLIVEVLVEGLGKLLFEKIGFSSVLQLLLHLIFCVHFLVI